MVRERGTDLQNPDFAGPGGRAWEVPGARGTEASGADVIAAASLGIWLIEAPKAHEFWEYRAATLVHLRDMPGAPPVKFKREGATHEFVLGTVDPAVNDIIDPTDMGTLKSTFRFLTPVDMQEQLILPSDDRALEVVRLAIQTCVDGRLIPDEDYRQNWTTFFRQHE